MGRSGSHFLSKSTIFNAFEEGIKQRIVVRHFGNHFINLLDRGIFLSSTYIENLKVSEYSCKLQQISVKCLLYHNPFIHLRCALVPVWVKFKQWRTTTFQDIEVYYENVAASTETCAAARRSRWLLAHDQQFREDSKYCWKETGDCASLWDNCYGGRLNLKS